MMKKVTVLLFTIILFTKANSQITKKNWLVGGNARFSSQSETLNSSDVKGLNITLSPNVGYFFVDKFAGGIRVQVAYNKVKFNGGVSRTTQLGVGPFLRYYFLNPDNRINLFSETTYQYIRSSDNNSVSSPVSNIFTFSAGPVIYFNTSVGLEFTLNYQVFKSNDTSTDAKTFFLSIGFQIHLEKDKTP